MTNVKPLVEVIEEHFHPSGSVKYTNIYGCQVNNSGGLFDLVVKEEMRRV